MAQREVTLIMGGGGVAGEGVGVKGEGQERVECEMRCKLREGREN